MKLSKTVVIGAHVDDQIFSIGEYLSEITGITLISVMAGVPDDHIGKKKHTLLREEHFLACECLVGSTCINFDFLDDVYPAPDIEQLRKDLSEIEYENIYIPVGIHHPDHILVSDEMINIVDKSKNIYFYEELPYAVLYPELLSKRLGMIQKKVGKIKYMQSEITDQKRALVRVYESQTKSDGLLRILDNQPERIWKLSQ